MGWTRWAAAGVVAVAIWTTGAPRTPAQEPVEELTKLSLTEVRLPPGIAAQTKVYTILPEVLLVNRFYRFTIDAPHAVYHIYGMGELVRTLHEVRVIEATRPLLDRLLGRTAPDRSGGAVLKATVEGARSAVLHPLETTKEVGRDVGRGLQRLGGKLKETFTASGSRPPEPPQPTATPPQPAFPRSLRARTAASLTLEVDSPNPYVQRLIDDAAQAYQEEKLTFRGGYLLTPFRGAEPAVPVLADSPSKLAAYANLEDPPAARAQAGEDLLRLGVDAALAGRLARSPAFSTAQLLRLRDAVRNLSYVDGLALRLEHLAGLPDQATVEVALQAVEIMRAENLAHGSIYALNRAVATSQRKVALDFLRQRQEGIIVTAADLLPKDAAFISTVNRLAAALRQGALKAAAIWCTGAVTAEARRYSARLNVPLREHVSPERVQAGL